MSFKRILAVGAHPDDVELGCSGTLLRMMQEGAEVDIVVCRDDNAPKPSVWRDRETMQKEYQSAEKMLGLKFNILKNPTTDDGRPVFEHNSVFVKMLDERGKGKGIKLGIKKAGCSGYEYTFDFVDEIISLLQSLLQRRPSSSDELVFAMVPRQKESHRPRQRGRRWPWPSARAPASAPLRGLAGCKTRGPWL